MRWCVSHGANTLCPRKNCNPRQCMIEMSNLNTSWPNFVCLIMNISATEMPNFIRKYYLLHELLIFGYWQQNISVSNIALHTAVRHSGRTTSHCWRRISLKSDTVCQYYGNVYRVTVFSWTWCTLHMSYFIVLYKYNIYLVAGAWLGEWEDAGGHWRVVPRPDQLKGQVTETCGVWGRSYGQPQACRRRLDRK